jgi:hypothetical protein
VLVIYYINYPVYQEKEKVMSSHLSREQKRFQSLKRWEKQKAENVAESFSLAAGLKRAVSSGDIGESVTSGVFIDERQALVLYNVAKTRAMKKKKGLL